MFARLHLQSRSPRVLPVHAAALLRSRRSFSRSSSESVHLLGSISMLAHSYVVEGVMRGRWTQALRSDLRPRLRHRDLAASVSMLLVLGQPSWS